MLRCARLARRAKRRREVDGGRRARGRVRCKLARWLSQRRCVALAPENVRARVQSKAVEQARRCSFRRPTRPALPLSARRPFSCSPPPTRATPPASSLMFRRFSQQNQSGSRPAPQQQPPPAGAKPASRHSSSASSSSPAQHQPAVPDLSALSLGSTPLAPAPPYEAIPSSSSPTGAAPPPPRSTRPAQGGARAPQRRSSIEDRLAPLGKYDLVLVVDGASLVLLLRASPCPVSGQLRLLLGPSPHRLAIDGRPLEAGRRGPHGRRRELVRFPPPLSLAPSPTS